MNEEKIKELEEQMKSIQSQIEQLKNPQFESGWYKTEHESRWLMYYDFENKKRYGFDVGGFWYYDSSTHLTDSFDRPATDKEVEEALIKEAKKIGFKEGVTIIRDFNHVAAYKNTLGNDLEFSPKYNACSNSFEFCGCYIFEGGKWAEIVEDKIMIGGYEVKKEDVFINIGCKSISRNDIISISNIMNIHEFKKVAFDGIETDLETIEKILKL